MEQNLDLPIALRRTRRSFGQSVQKPQTSTTTSTRVTPKKVPHKRDAPGSQTPKSRKRRVRFSDPGPETTWEQQHATPSTGLTPLIKRTTLSSSSSKTPRRRSTPARLCPGSGRGVTFNPFDTSSSPFSGEVRFLPLRQVLDGRVKRRIRRNGLSEEMNTISAEKRRRSEEAKAEMERLRVELAEKDEEIERLQDETVVLDTERVWDLEKQVEALRKELASRSEGVGRAEGLDERDGSGGSEGGLTDFDEDTYLPDGEEEVVSSTPPRRMQMSFQTSFPTPPATSPEPGKIMSSPQTPSRRLFDTPRSSLSIEVDPWATEREELEEELDSLRLEVSKLSASLETYTALTTRLSDQLPPTPTEDSSPNQPTDIPDLETRLTTVLHTLTDQTTALSTLHTSLQTLGFPGSSAFEILDSLRTAFRTARLELEYLSPGESTLPLTGSGAALLTHLLTQLRTLSSQHRAATDALDEAHASQLSLRQQLSARASAMDTLAAELSTSQQDRQRADARAAELEHRLTRLRTAARAYACDIVDLEQLVHQLEDEIEDKSTTITDLDGKLSDALANTTTLQADIATLTAVHEKELAERDGEVGRLGTELETAQSALEEMKGVVEGLRKEKEELGDMRIKERREAVMRMGRMRGELERFMGMVREEEEALEGVV